MKRLGILLVSIFMVGLLAACSSPEQKAALESFDTEKARIEAQVATLTEEMQTADELAKSEQKALDESLRATLSEDINATRTIADGTDIPKAKTKAEEIDEQTAVLKTIDLTADLDKLKASEKALSDSMKQYQLVNQPSAEYVSKCMQRIGYIDNIAILTEETDDTNNLGKAGWYTGKVVFHSTNVEHTGYDNGYTTLEAIGNPAGGCVEIFASEEDANRRNEELKGMEGTVRNPGAHQVIGTIVIRASQDQKTSTMEQQIVDMKTELTRLDA